ncbi:MAG: hypothetical protein M1561_02260 [Gammaproteobacteria bacterium]|nr:hypothetical protein [Gammaproteobacteria bacterium]
MRIHVIYGEHVGVIKSYFELLQHIPDDATFVGLADQDDVWFPFKISHAVAMLSQYPTDLPILYRSALQITDEKLKVIRLSRVPKKELSYRNIVLENSIPGCTMFLNGESIQIIRENIVYSPEILMHDWWVALFITMIGKVIFDDQPTLFYRRHPSAVTVVPLATSGLKLFLFRVWHYFVKREKNCISKQVTEFMRLHSAIIPERHRCEVNYFLYV